MGALASSFGIWRSRGTAGVCQTPRCSDERRGSLTRQNAMVCNDRDPTSGGTRMAATGNTNTEFELRGINHLALVCRDMARICHASEAASVRAARVSRSLRRTVVIFAIESQI